jgi:hypothetical protein
MEHGRGAVADRVVSCALGISRAQWEDVLQLGSCLIPGVGVSVLPLLLISGGFSLSPRMEGWSSLFPLAGGSGNSPGVSDGEPAQAGSPQPHDTGYIPFPM